MTTRFSRSHSRVLCKSHGVQEVTDYALETKMLTLACECTRKLYTSDALASFEEPQKRHRGSNQKIQVWESA